ncbi:GNAT family N-acetyltransferase [Marininema halotolerans]|uniref:Ribosomal protein S18 acetylase RimI n=1 Tax=Marininema halotolerans TaxID=1155944 RepID=A0A1I6PLY6_9BACL|nr:GNAT family N-acetyltransferase [Marininema halotolerans]SFS41211.1 Ribosomal protein S18 acetylase RimI [Marininema halotolerans]
MHSIRSLHARPYDPQKDEAVAMDFHLELMRNHYQLWAEITGEEYDSAYWEHTLTVEKAGKQWTEELAERHEDENTYIQMYSLTSSDEPIGILYLDIRRDHLTFQNAGYINEIYLAPEYQGQGLSRQILLDGETWFAKKGISSRQVFVTSNNLAAVRLYESMGYRVADYRMIKTEG